MTGYCFLTQKLPDSIKISEKKLKIDTSTATAIACLLNVTDISKTSIEKAEYCTLRLFGLSYSCVLVKLNCTGEQLDRAIMKYLDGAPELRPKLSNEISQSKKSFDFVQDSGAIVSSFRQMYGLSVEEIQALHYWEFRTLFENLTGENAFNNIKNIRTMKIEKTDSPERKEEIKRAKKALALIDTRTSEQKKADLQQQLNALLL